MSITNSIIQAIFGLFTGALSALLPTSSGFGSDAITAIQGIAPYVRVWGVIVPFWTAGQVLLATVTFEAGLLVFKIVTYLLDKVSNVA